MSTVQFFRGCHTAIVTPFYEDGAFDTAAMRALLDWQLAAGINGIAACGTTGESVALDEDEYRMVLETVIGHVAGRVPVICGAGTNCTEKAIKLAKIAETSGADAILSVTPYYNKPTQAGLFEHFRAIVETVSVPVILYNVPGRTGVNMTAETTCRLAELPGIAGVKEASGDLVQVMQILRDRPADFVVLSGDDALTLPMIAAGADGVISVVSNEIPGAFTRLVQAALRGDFAEARELQQRYLALMQVNFIESNPIPVKTALAMMGKIRECFRLPLVPMQAKTREKLAAELKKCGLIE